MVDEHGREVTFGEFRDLAERAAAGLHARGVGPGTRVMWMLPTWIESLVLSAALSRLGAIQVPLIPVYRQREIGFIARQTAAPLMLVPRVWRGTDYVDLATSATATMDEPPTHRRRPRPARRRSGDAAPSTATTVSHRSAMDLLHVGNDVGPEGRASTPTPPSPRRRGG